jgi:uncharacterized protein with HEPN domain
MRAEERDVAHLWDLLQMAVKSVELLRDRELADYLADENLCLVIERRLEIMGEAARRISVEFKAAHQEIPWSLMIGQRNVMAHQYDEVDQDQRQGAEGLASASSQSDPLSEQHRGRGHADAVGGPVVLEPCGGHLPGLGRGKAPVEVA